MGESFKCPACHSYRTQPCFVLTAEEAAQHYILREDRPQLHEELACHIRRLWGTDSCAIRECTDCQFGFAFPFIAGDVTFYKLAYDRTNYPAEKWEYERTMLDLTSTGFRGKNVLEAGSGFGWFLDKIADIYVPRSGITALEYSDQAIEVLRRKGYNVLQQDLRKAVFRETFDAIFLFQVLEHMDDIDTLFSRLSQLLSFDGQLFVAVPNAKFLKFNEANESMLDCPPNHIGRWSPEAFRNIGLRHGMRLDYFEVEPFSLFEFAKTDIKYSYLRRTLNPRSLANWSRTIRSKVGGKFVEKLVATLFAPSRVPVWRKAALAGGLGWSLWAKFSRAK